MKGSKFLTVLSRLSISLDLIYGGFETIISNLPSTFENQLLLINVILLPILNLIAFLVAKSSALWHLSTATA